MFCTTFPRIQLQIRAAAAMVALCSVLSPQLAIANDSAYWDELSAQLSEIEDMAQSWLDRYDSHEEHVSSLTDWDVEGTIDHAIIAGIATKSVTGAAIGAGTHVATEVFHKAEDAYGIYSDNCEMKRIEGELKTSIEDFENSH